MNDEREHSGARLEREKTLYLYSTALESGDFDTVEFVLHRAEDDPILEQMILEMNSVYREEFDTTADENARETVLRLLHEKLPSAWGGKPAETDIPPLTVGDVVARLQADAARRPADQEIVSLVQRLYGIVVPLPDNLSQRSVTALFDRFGLTASKRAQDLFRETAIFLSMGREQGMVRLAAARRQRQAQQGIPADKEKRP